MMKKKKMGEDRLGEKVQVAIQFLSILYGVHFGNKAEEWNLLYLAYRKYTGLDLCEVHVVHSFLFDLESDVMIMTMMMMTE